LAQTARAGTSTREWRYGPFMIRKSSKVCAPGQPSLFPVTSTGSSKTPGPFVRPPYPDKINAGGAEGRSGPRRAGSVTSVAALRDAPRVCDRHVDVGGDSRSGLALSDREGGGRWAARRFRLDAGSGSGRRRVHRLRGGRALRASRSLGPRAERPSLPWRRVSHRLGRTVVAAGRPSGRSAAACFPQRVHSGILRSGSEPKGRRLLPRLLPAVPTLECADSVPGSCAGRCLRSRGGRQRQHLRPTRKLTRSATRPHCPGAKAPVAHQRSCLRRARRRRGGIWEPIDCTNLSRSRLSERCVAASESRFSSVSSSRRRAG
jgi:hypothetical protein